MNFLERHRIIVSTFLGIILCAIVLSIWTISNNELQQSLKGKVSDTNELVVNQVNQVFFQNVNLLANLKRRLEFTDGDFFEYWNKDAQSIISQEPSFLFVEWIDKDMVIQRVEPFEGNEEALGLDISGLDYRNTDWNRARKDSTFNLTHWMELTQGDYSFLIDEPVYNDGKFLGTITAGMDFTARFNTIMEGLEQYHVEIMDEKGTTFYSHGSSSGTDTYQELAVSDNLFINDASKSKWTIFMVPNHLFAEASAIDKYNVNLFLTLLLSIILATSFYFMQKASAAEKSYKKSNNNLRSLIDSAPIAIYVIDSEGIVVDFWNNAAEKMLGWTKEEALGSLLPIIGKNNAEEIEQNIQESIEKGGISNKEITRKRKDKSEGNFRLNIGSITGKEGHMLVLLEDITKEKEFESKLKSSLDEKNTLLKEVHHRVKNNLAIIVGLMELHSDEVKDPQTQFLLSETKNRILAISEVHELLYRNTNFSEISLSEYVSKLVSRMHTTYQSGDSRVTFNTDIEDFKVNINQAIPTGLVLNELIINSYKHAFPDKKIKNPTIDISFKKSGGVVQVHYADNGIGLEASKFENASSMGLTITRTLLQQLSAEYTLSESEGFGIKFEFQAKERGAHSNL